MDGTGYKGLVTLESPTGERVTVPVPKRFSYPRSSRDDEGRRWGKFLHEYHWAPLCARAETRFLRLLSAGWKVVACNGQQVRQEEGEVGEEEKKNTDLVDGAAQSGNASHGGEHASAEVEDSPNAAKCGTRSRKCRGGQKHRRKRAGQRLRPIRVQSCQQQGGGAVFAPQPLQVDPGLLECAEESAALLAELVGRSHLKVRRGVSVNAEKLLVALEVGDNPLPPLEDPDERPKIKVLVTPDCSGSCQGWSGVSCAWALHLSKLPDVDVVYVENSNGEFWEIGEDAASRKLVESVDVVLYLGDGDGTELCRQYASQGATVVALDSYCANDARPRLKSENLGQGVLHWVDRVSSKIPVTWTEAIALCLKN